MLDIEGFTEFIEKWWQEPGIDYKDYMSPCIQCVKSKMCTPRMFYRLGGEQMKNGSFTRSYLVCDDIVGR